MFSTFDEAIINVLALTLLLKGDESYRNPRVVLRAQTGACPG